MKILDKLKIRFWDEHGNKDLRLLKRFNSFQDDVFIDISSENAKKRGEIEEKMAEILKNLILDSVISIIHTIKLLRKDLYLIKSYDNSTKKYVNDILEHANDTLKDAKKHIKLLISNRWSMKNSSVHKDFVLDLKHHLTKNMELEQRIHESEHSGKTLLRYIDEKFTNIKETLDELFVMYSRIKKNPNDDILEISRQAAKDPRIKEVLSNFEHAAQKMYTTARSMFSPVRYASKLGSFLIAGIMASMITAGDVNADGLVHTVGKKGTGYAHPISGDIYVDQNNVPVRFYDNHGGEARGGGHVVRSKPDTSKLTSQLITYLDYINEIKDRYSKKQFQDVIQISDEALKKLKNKLSKKQEKWLRYYKFNGEQYLKHR